MPYIVTTKTPEGTPGTYTHYEQRAVATLEEARLWTFDTRMDQGPFTWDIGEQGGAVELPDGTVIEVERVKWRALFDSSGLDSRHIHDEPGILAAYNRTQD